MKTVSTLTYAVTLDSRVRTDPGPDNFKASESRSSIEQTASFTGQPRGASPRTGVRKRLGPRPGGSELPLLCRSYRWTSLRSEYSLHEGESVDRLPDHRGFNLKLTGALANQWIGLYDER
jgi:hypothetical protein